MINEKKWFKSLKDKSKINIHIREEFKTVMTIVSRAGNEYGFKSDSNEMVLAFTIDKDFAWINFVVLSYLWAAVIDQHSETIEKICVEGERLVIVGNTNTYVLEKQV